MKKFTSLIFIIAWAFHYSAFAKHIPDDTNLSPFNVIMGEIRSVSAADDWRFNRWNKQKLTNSISQLLKKIGELTNDENINQLVLFENVTPVIGNKRRLENNLYVTKQGDISRAENSIIISDDNVEIGFATNSIILSRGTVKISHGGNNIIISGHFIHVSHEGKRSKGRSVLVSGSVAEVSHADNTIICAPVLVRIAHAKNVTFINSLHLRVSHERDSIQLVDKSGMLPANVLIHDLFNTLQITQVVPHRDREKALVVIQHADIEKIIRIDGSIPDATGEMIDWKLAFVSDDFVLFEKNGQYASYHITESP